IWSSSPSVSAPVRTKSSFMPPGLPISWPASGISSGAVALLVLLARAAPARVVPADLVAVGLDHGLLLDRRAVAALRLALDRPPGGGARPGGRRSRRLPGGGGLLGGPPRVVPAPRLHRRGELLLSLRCHHDLHVEDQPGELLPDR